MITLEIRSYDETLVARHLLDFEDALQAPREALEDAATIMREAVSEQFASEGAHASGGWKPLAMSTLARKEELGLHSEILRATDALMNSLTNKLDSQHIERQSGSSLTFGSTVPYGIYHQSTMPRTRLPYRPPVALTEEDKRKMLKTVQAALTRSIRAAA